MELVKYTQLKIVRSTRRVAIFQISAVVTTRVTAKQVSRAIPNAGALTLSSMIEDIRPSASSDSATSGIVKPRQIEAAKMLPIIATRVSCSTPLHE